MTRLALVALLIAGALAGCGGGDDSPPPREVEAVFDEEIPRMRAGDSVRVVGIHASPAAAAGRSQRTSRRAYGRGSSRRAGTSSTSSTAGVPATAENLLRDGDRIPPERTSWNGATAEDVMRDLAE